MEHRSDDHDRTGDVGRDSAHSPATSPRAERGAECPNIIYILADDLGYGDVGFNGQEKILTPAIDRMADEGLVFSQHYAGGPVCGPSRACLMTGMSQAVGTIKGNPGGDWQRENLPDDEITMADKLQEAGYSTACFGKWGLGQPGKSGYPLNQGFDEFIGYDTHSAAHDYYPEELCANEGVMRLDQSEGNRTYSHDVFTEKALDYVDRDHERPFFLYLPYTIPHSPYNPPSLEPYDDRDWDDLHKRYAAMVTRMDRDVGRLLDRLHENGIADNTLVIFTSDNGPQSSYGDGPNEMTKFFNSNGLFRGIKRDVLEGGVRVPTVAWWPGTIESRTTDHVSAFQDVMPTFCDLADVRSPENSDGISFLPTLLDRPEEQEQHNLLYWEFIRMTEEHGGRQAVLDVANQWKAVRYGRNDTPRLYDLDQSLKERENVRDQHSDIAARLNRAMDEMRSASELWPVEWLDDGWKPRE